MKQSWQDWSDAELEPVARALRREEAGIGKSYVGDARRFLRHLEFYGLTIIKLPPGDHEGDK